MAREHPDRVSAETALLAPLPGCDPLRDVVDGEPWVDQLGPFIGVLVAAAIGSLLWVALVMLIRLVV